MNIEARRPKCGYLYHAVPEGSKMAVCGYSPSGGTYRMRDRSGWYGVLATSWHAVTCRKCLKKRDDA